MLGPKNGGAGCNWLEQRRHPGRGITCAKAQGQCSSEQCLEQGEQLGQGAHTAGQGTLGQGRVRAGDPDGWLLALSGAREPGCILQKPGAGRCRERRGWYTGTPHPLSLGHRTGLTSLFDSSGHFFFLNSFPPQRIGISKSP